MLLIVCTIVAFRQIDFLAHKDIGFNRENLMVLTRADRVNDRQTFLQAIKNVNGVQEVSWSTSVPPDLYDGDQFKARGADKLTPLNYVKTDEHFSGTLGLELKIGRNFSADIPGDRNSVILNETAVDALGWKNDESVLGKIIEKSGEGNYEVIGVVRDFNYWALQAPIQPMAIFHYNSEVFSAGKNAVVLRVNPADTKQLAQIIKSVETT